MSGVKAKLRVVLQADETVVAESDDAGLWQRVLLAINSGNGAVDLSPVAEKVPAPPGQLQVDASPAVDDDLGRFARAIGTTRELVQGACAPSKSSPYLTLDMHCWDSMKEQTPPRGPGAINPIAMAATLLALWMQAAKLGPATQAEAQKVLRTINLRDANPTRGINASDWLQARSGGVVVLNPARAKRAVAIAKAFCTQDWKSEAAKGGSTE